MLRNLLLGLFLIGNKWKYICIEFDHKNTLRKIDTFNIETQRSLIIIFGNQLTLFKCFFTHFSSFRVQFLLSICQRNTHPRSNLCSHHLVIWLNDRDKFGHPYCPHVTCFTHSTAAGNFLPIFVMVWTGQLHENYWVISWKTVVINFLFSKLFFYEDGIHFNVTIYTWLTNT